MSGFEHLLSVVRTLRGEGGCPWDRAQTPETLRRFMVEECFETVDAIGEGDAAHVREELGDLFFNVLLDACIYEERGDFTVDGCLHGIAEKLERRHPHVFPNSGGSAEADPDIGLQWERIKERVEGRGSGVFDGVPASFPPLLRAAKLLARAERRGFAWPSAADARAKVSEELSEADEAAAGGDAARVEAEVGDLLLSVAGWARLLGVDPSVALSRANAKFKSRVESVVGRMEGMGLPMDAAHRAEMAECWRAAKSPGG